jgi:hypothetical protein
MPLLEAVRSAEVSADDKIAIAAACIEEEALRRTGFLVAGPDPARVWEWYVAHGGRFRWSQDGEDLMIQVPVPPFVLDPPRCARRGCGRPQPAHDILDHAFKPA